MRRCLELSVLVATAGILLATSQARVPCVAETVNLRTDTTCGPPANLAVSSTPSCTVTAIGADFGGLPTAGYVNAGSTDAGVLSGFQLTGMSGDAGNVRTCSVTPGADAGFDVKCTPTCGDPDAGPCEPTCSGTLAPQFQKS